MTARMLCLTLCLSLGTMAAADDRILATVNGRPITAAAVQGDLFLRQLPEHASPAEREQVVERLIDRELIRQFLERRKVVADADRVEFQLQALRRLLEMKGEKPDEVLGRWGLDDPALRSFLALPIAWKQHVAGVITEQRIREEWKQSGFRFDGTKVTASQIVRLVDRDAPESDWQAATSFLEELRGRLQKGEISFAEAARMHSQSPSGANGGSLGEFEFHGHVARQIAEAAFALKPGEISPPVRSAGGVHLIRVDKRQPGDLSLEDVRPQLIDEISSKLWQEQVARERQSAKIVRD